MRRVRLFFREMAQIVGSDGLSAVVLSDDSRQRALTLVFDHSITEQMSLRLRNVPGHETFLPEVLLCMIDPDVTEQMEMLVYDVDDGQYRVTLLNQQTLTLRAIRMSDAVLLSIMAPIPLYIDEHLFERQSSPYEAGSQGLYIPINTIDTQRLTAELEKAIANEDYRLASNLHKELESRRSQSVNKMK